MAKNQTIYRAWDGEVLLYIGFTVNPGNRLAAHRKESSWWERATHLTFERLPDDVDRCAALAAEAQAIRDERPLYNIVGHPNPQPRLRISPSRGVGGPKLLQQIIAVADSVRTRREEIAEIDAEIRRLIRQALDEGHGPTKLAEAIGISRGRVYQIAGPR